MNHESLDQFLGEIDLFNRLSVDTRSDLVERGTTFELPPGRHVTDQGEHDTGLHVVMDGSADVSVNGVFRGTLRPGDYFGEISLIDGLPRSSTVVAGPDGLTTFALSALAFEPVIKENSDVADALLKALCARIRAIEESER